MDLGSWDILEELGKVFERANLQLRDQESAQVCVVVTGQVGFNPAPETKESPRHGSERLLKERVSSV